MLHRPDQLLCDINNSSRDWQRILQGVKKTRLGLREVVSLGDFLQIIDTSAATAVRFSITCSVRNTWPAYNCSRSALTADFAGEPSLFQPESFRKAPGEVDNQRHIQGCRRL